MKSIFAYYKLVSFIIMLAFSSSCDFLDTREPESPNVNTQSFITPTSPNLVIQNFVNSIKEKNSNNYIQCFADSSLDFKRSFIFIPLSSTLAAYPNIFLNWNANSERVYLNSLFSKSNPEKGVNITLSEQSFENYSLDSAVYNAKYLIAFTSGANGVEQKYSGMLRMSLLSKLNGNWAIGVWQDFAIQNDSNKKTWSDLKAEYSY